MLTCRGGQNLTYHSLIPTLPVAPLVPSLPLSFQVLYILHGEGPCSMRKTLTAGNLFHTRGKTNRTLPSPPYPALPMQGLPSHQLLGLDLYCCLILRMTVNLSCYMVSPTQVSAVVGTTAE